MDDKTLIKLMKIADKMKADKIDKDAVKEKHKDLAKGKSMTDAQFLKYLRELHGIK
jgi:molecular chaperone GrpE (heat shock protein)